MIKSRPLQEKQPLSSFPKRPLLPSCLLWHSAFRETTQIPGFLTDLFCFLVLSLCLSAKPEGRGDGSKQWSLISHPAMAAAPCLGCHTRFCLPSRADGCKRWEGEELLRKAAADRWGVKCNRRETEASRESHGVGNQGLTCSAAATRELSVQQPGRPPVPSPWMQALPC